MAWTNVISESSWSQQHTVVLDGALSPYIVLESNHNEIAVNHGAKSLCIFHLTPVTQKVQGSQRKKTIQQKHQDYRQIGCLAEASELLYFGNSTVLPDD